jgi:hypothetical protein
MWHPQSEVAHHLIYIQASLFQLLYSKDRVSLLLIQPRMPVHHAGCYVFGRAGLRPRPLSVLAGILSSRISRPCFRSVYFARSCNVSLNQCPKTSRHPQPLFLSCPSRLSPQLFPWALASTSLIFLSSPILLATSAPLCSSSTAIFSAGVASTRFCFSWLGSN